MVPELGFWERADVQLGKLNILANVLYAAITGVFRGKSSPKFYSAHLLATAIRTTVDRYSARQTQYVWKCSRYSNIDQSYMGLIHRRHGKEKLILILIL